MSSPWELSENQRFLEDQALMMHGQGIVRSWQQHMQELVAHHDEDVMPGDIEPLSRIALRAECDFYPHVVQLKGHSALVLSKVQLNGCLLPCSGVIVERFKAHNVQCAEYFTDRQADLLFTSISDYSDRGLTASSY